MEQVIQNLVRVLRGSGVRISLAESLEAMRAVRLVGYDDRRILRHALAATLAKSQSEIEVFDDCFDRFFALPGEQEAVAGTPAAQLIEPAAGDAELTRLLLTMDVAALDLAMRRSAEEAGVGGMRFFTQKGFYIRRILVGMGIEAVDRDVAAAARQGGVAAHQKTERLRELRDLLFERVRDHVEQQVSLYAMAATDEVVEKYLRDIRLSNLERRDFDRMQRIVQRIVKRLNDRHSRRRKRATRGRLDLRRTLRANLAYEGTLCDLRWKSKRVERPDIVAICDVSRSVEAVARFMLMFLYGLNETVARIRSFIFCSNMVEISHVFDTMPLAEALGALQRGRGLGIQLGATDYGRSWLDFERNWLPAATPKTTLLVLGDARNNYGDPRTDIMRLLHERCRSVIWLNPEPPSLWGTGDSEMRHYLPHCSLARECNTVNHLTRVVDFLLRARG